MDTNPWVRILTLNYVQYIDSHGPVFTHRHFSTSEMDFCAWLHKCKREVCQEFGNVLAYCVSLTHKHVFKFMQEVFAGCKLDYSDDYDWVGLLVVIWLKYPCFYVNRVNVLACNC